MANSRTWQVLLGIACAVLVGSAVAGCGGGGVDSTGGGSGTLAVHMSDGGGADITAANVTITRIEAHSSGGWQTVFSGNLPVDLLDMRNNDVVIGSSLVPATRYNQVRLFVTDATVTDSTGVHPVTIPSAVQSGIKLNLDCSIEANTVTAVLLDFNVGKSFVVQGNGTYLLKPVIPVVVKILSGTATGTVSDAGGLVSGASVTATYEAGSNYSIGTVVNTTFTQSDGTFKMWALLPGTYTFTFSYTNPVTTLVETATVTGVVISANANTDLGAVALL